MWILGGTEVLYLLSVFIRVVESSIISMDYFMVMCWCNWLMYLENYFRMFGWFTSVNSSDLVIDIAC